MPSSPLQLLPLRWQPCPFPRLLSGADRRTSFQQGGELLLQVFRRHGPGLSAHDIGATSSGGFARQARQSPGPASTCASCKPCHGPSAKAGVCDTTNYHRRERDCMLVAHRPYLARHRVSLAWLRVPRPCPRRCAASGPIQSMVERVLGVRAHGAPGRALYACRRAQPAWVRGALTPRLSAARSAAREAATETDSQVSGRETSDFGHPMTAEDFRRHVARPRPQPGGVVAACHVPQGSLRTQARARGGGLDRGLLRGPPHARARPEPGVSGIHHGAAAQGMPRGGRGMGCGYVRPGRHHHARRGDGREEVLFFTLTA